MRTILLALAAEERRLNAATADVTAAGLGHRQSHALRRERDEYLRLGIRHDLVRWLGHAPTPSESAVFSRTLRTMEACGLLVRVSRWGSRRTTHVRLTATGRAQAERLVREHVPEPDGEALDVGNIAAELSAAMLRDELDPGGRTR
ncbi:MAG: hypothetical protein D6760_06790 [Deltaproteobacteria bacterium]|nr:MAG: hypothetical protein D6760_06790 [Deltaproteobacteria bacterium]